MNSINRRKILVVLLFVFIFSLSAMVCAQNKTSVFASDTKALSEVTYTMENGASIYNNQNRLGVRFGAYMSEADYTALKNNVGENKEYNSLSFGVVIAPASYEDVENGGYGKLNEENLFGSQTKTAIYDWATWNNETGAWEYPTSDKIRVINIETGSLKIAGTKASHSGSITNILKMNLLNEFKGVAYVRAEKIDGSFEYKFATESDNERNVVYVAQLRQQAIKEEISELDEIDDAEEIATLNTESTTLGNTYITNDVRATDATYTVEHYYAKPDKSGHFLYETTTKTGKINATLSADSASGSIITGVDFDEENENNASSPVIFAQDKSTVKVYYDVTYGADADETEKVYDISLTEDYAVDSGITAVYSADMSKISNTDGKIANKTIVDMGKGERDLYVLTENGFETYSTIMATHVIKTGEEFVNFVRSFSGTDDYVPKKDGDGNILYIDNETGEETTSSKDENGKSNKVIKTDEVSNGSFKVYAVLANDIDCGMANVAKNDSDRFWGTFNGMGHSVINVTSNYKGGLFGALQKVSDGTGGIVKNTYFEITAKERSSNVALLFGYVFSGEISNIYVRGFYNGLDDYAGISQNSFAHANNSIFEVIYANSSAEKTYVFNGATSDNVGTLDQVYTISRDSALAPKNAERPYDDFDSFYSVNKKNITQENGFNKYWKATDEGLYFGDMLIKTTDYVSTWDYNVDNDVSYTVALGSAGYGKDSVHINDWKVKETVSIDVATIFGSTPTNVMLNGSSLDITDGKVVVDLSSVSLGGTYPLLISDANKKVSVPVMIVTHAISTADEFLAWLDMTKIDRAISHYAVLLEDVTVNSSFSRGGDTARFQGTLDGLGHVVKGLSTTDTGGIFGGMQTYATSLTKPCVKNIAFVDYTYTGSGGALLGFYYGGTIKNVYMKGTCTRAQGCRGILSRGNGGTLSNCVFDLTMTLNTGAVIHDYNGSDITSATKVTWTLNNSYAISNASQLLKSDSESKPYESFDAVSVTLIEDVMQGGLNKWASCWKVIDSSLYFGNTLIGPSTAQ